MRRADASHIACEGVGKSVAHTDEKCAQKLAVFVWYERTDAQSNTVTQSAQRKRGRGKTVDFLTFVKKNACPLDFFSYHQYGMDMKFVRDAANYARRRLDEEGFTEAKIIVDEWNASASTRELYWIGTMRGARHVLSMMMAYQDSPVDIANYYDGQPHMVHCGIFDKYRRKMKPFYTFVLFNKLYALGSRIAAECDDGGFTEALAAKDEGGRAGLLVVGSMQDPYIEIRGFEEKPAAYILSEEKNIEQIAVKYENGIASVVVPTGNIIYFEA